MKNKGLTQFHHEKLMIMIMAMQQEPIYWRYLPYVRPIFQAYVSYVREDPHKIWPYMVQYLHFRILNFPLILSNNYRI